MMEWPQQPTSAPQLGPLDDVDLFDFLPDLGGAGSGHGSSGYDTGSPSPSTSSSAADAVSVADVMASLQLPQPPLTAPPVPHAGSMGGDATPPSVSCIGGGVAVAAAHKALPPQQVAPPALPLPSLGKRSGRCGSGSGSGSGSDVDADGGAVSGSGGTTGGTGSGRGGTTAAPTNGGDDVSAKRAKRAERLRRNRESAAKSRQRQKEKALAMERTLTALRASVAAKDVEIARLNQENRLLREQMEYMRSLVATNMASKPSGSSPTSSPANTPAGAPAVVTGVPPLPLRTGAVMFVVVLAFAVCLAPAAHGPSGLAAWVSGASGVAPTDPLAASAASSPLMSGSTRGLLSPDDDMVHAVDVTDGGHTADTPPLPQLWSPTAAVTFALYALGMHHAARSVLTHVFGVAVAVAVVVLAKVTLSRHRDAVKRCTPPELPVATGSRGSSGAVANTPASTTAGDSSVASL